MIRHNITIWLCIVALAHYCFAQNLVLNPSFESGSTSWSVYGNGFTIDTTTAEAGTSSCYCTAASSTVTTGAYQVLTLNQASASAITLQAWAKAQAALTNNGGSYALYADILQTDGTWVYGQQSSFSASSTSWNAVSFVVNTGKPINQVWLYLLFRNVQGSVWFDNVYVGPSSGAPTIPSTSTTTTAKAGSTTGSAPATTGKAASTTGSASTTGKAASTTGGSGTTTGGSASYYTIGLKYMLLASAMDDIRLGAAQQTLDSIGALYDIILTTEVSGNFSLTNTDGSGKYLGLVYTLDILSLPAMQQAQLAAYQQQFYVKAVYMYTYPYSSNGVQPSALGSTSALGNLTFASAASGYTSGFNPSAVIPNDGVYTYPSQITDSTIAQPALYITYDGTTNYVAAAFVTLNTNTRSLQFFFDQATWCLSSTALGMFWVQWVSNNMYVGRRRVFLNTHGDDLFMDSDEWNIEASAETETISQRITASDLLNYANFQTTINSQLPAGSNYTHSWPFNGETVKEYGGYTKDPLYIQAKALINSFTFMSHTYDHPELDNLTYAKVKKEMTDNFEITLQLFGSYNHPRYSNNSMVTPSISGLFNGNALQALWDVGIKHVVGDNSRNDIRTPFVYHGWYTNKTVNGFAGMYVMPREATNIYYDCGTVDDEVAEYNHIYRDTFGESTFDDIYEREAARVARNLLAFRLDSYMFHQANIRGFTYNGKATSLLQHWVETITATLSQYYALPILSHSEDILVQQWLQREARDASGFSGSIKVDASTHKIVALNGQTTQACSMAFTGVPVAASSTVTLETYGPDTTAYVQTTANKAFTLTLSTPIQM